MQTITVTGQGASAIQLVAAGSGVTLLVNADPANTVYLGDSSSANPNDPTNVVPLEATQSIVVNGSGDVYGMCGPGLSAQIYIIPGGISFFQLLTKLVIAEITPSSGIFVYAGFPADGDLNLSIAAVSGIDPYGNPYPAGLTVGENNTQINLVSENDGQGIIYFLMNDDTFINGFLAGQLIDNELASIILQGPQGIDAPENDYVSLAMYSGNLMLGLSAQLSLYYVDSDADEHSYLYMSYAGLSTTGLATGIEPGTGTSQTNAAIPETWHNIPLTADWEIETGGYVAKYRINANGNIELCGRIQCITTASLTISTALPTGYFPTGGIPQWTAPVSVIADGTVTAGQTARIALSDTGILSVAGVTAEIGMQLSLDGVMFPQSAA